MEKLIGALVLALGAIGLVVGLAFLMAFPTMWAVNYLFSPALLTFVFGMAKIRFWQALVLNFISATLFKVTTISSGKK